MKNKSVEICVYITGETEAAFWVTEDEEKPEDAVALAKSHIELPDGDFVENYGEGDTIEGRVPLWVATQKGFI